MQLDGMFIDNNNQETAYNYHVINAFDGSNPNDTVDTSFSVNIGGLTIGSNTYINMKMDVSEWFKKPNMWDLNEFDTNLMGNYDVQLLMNQNGSSVFDLISITQ